MERAIESQSKAQTQIIILQFFAFVNFEIKEKIWNLDLVRLCSEIRGYSSRQYPCLSDEFDGYYQEVQQN